MYDINFMVYAYDKDSENDVYASMVVPYIFFALQTNSNSHVEVIVVDSIKFKKKYNKELALLRRKNKNFKIREPVIKHNRHIPNTYRFFEKPVVEATYTYITDIDIIFLGSDILDKYKCHWPNNLPYNNILRNKDSTRLTGVCMIKTKEYYTEEFDKCRDQLYALDKNINDEVILGNMCEKLFGLPNYDHRFRPIYGIHFSPNRGNGCKLGLVTSKKYYDKYMEFKSKHPLLFSFQIFKKLTYELENNFKIVE